ncbi:leukosialin isoform X3 [Dermochelys coriacea]|uniref:leukosialin isoform X3 n=1 Tax=Dermochelys coriacea TaxID=27794 RepID=UPI001CAA324F|nr:leukosialin isoform X3 [Dermochelys coriacea]
MVVSGAWPQPKILATLLLLLVAAACAEMPPEWKRKTRSASHEKSQHIETGPETTWPSTKLAGNSPSPSAELAGNSPGPSAELAMHPPTAAQQIPTTTPTLAKEEPVGSGSPSALPTMEAAVSSGPARATAEGGEKPVLDLKREGLKGQVGTVPGSPGPGQENQTVPGRSGQSKSAPTEPTKAEGADWTGHNRTEPASTERTMPASADWTGHNRTEPASTDRTVPASTDRTGHPGKDQTTPKLSPSAQPPIPPVKKQTPNPEALFTMPGTSGSSPAPITHSLPVGIIVVLVVVALLMLVLLLVVLHCRHQRRSGSTSFSAGQARHSEWAGPVSLPEERGEGQAGDGGQQARPGEARRPTLTTFFGKRHSRVSSVAMEDMAVAKGEGPLSEPLLATGEQGSEPAPQGAGEANGTVPLMPRPPSPPPDLPANGEFPLPPPMEQEAMPPM